MAANDGESTPLLPVGESSNYYFLQSGETTSDPGAVVDGMPAGAQPDAFEPKVLSINVKVGRLRAGCIQESMSTREH
jgi:hypothetical protein